VDKRGTLRTVPVVGAHHSRRTAFLIPVTMRSHQNVRVEHLEFGLAERPANQSTSKVGFAVYGHHGTTNANHAPQTWTLVDV
jgi:hypothetical protein